MLQRSQHMFPEFRAMSHTAGKGTSLSWGTLGRWGPWAFLVPQARPQAQGAGETAVGLS